MGRPGLGRELEAGFREGQQEGSLCSAHRKETVGMHWRNRQDQVRGFCGNLLRGASSQGQGDGGWDKWPYSENIPKLQKTEADRLGVGVRERAKNDPKDSA